MLYFDTMVPEFQSQSVSSLQAWHFTYFYENFLTRRVCVCSELRMTGSLHQLALSFSKREGFLFSLMIQNKRAVVSRSGLGLLNFCVCEEDRQTEAVSRDLRARLRTLYYCKLCKQRSSFCLRF